MANKNDLAIKYASEALVNSSMQVPYAAWTAGLASWRLKKYQKVHIFLSSVDHQISNIKYQKVYISDIKIQ